MADLDEPRIVEADAQFNLYYPVLAVPALGTASTRKRLRFATAIYLEFDALAARGLGPTDIADLLTALAQHLNGPKAQGPSTRSVARWLKDRRSADSSPRWRLSDTAPEDGALVLEVLAAVYAETDKRVRTLTRSEAIWIVRIRKAAPSLALWKVYRWAQAAITTTWSDGQFELAFATRPPSAFDEVVEYLGDPEASDPNVDLSGFEN